MEVWRDIEGFPNYAISNLGRIENIRTGKILNPSKVGGFDIVGLRRNDRPAPRYVHRLMADAFLGGDIEGRQVKHVDGNKDRTHVENLIVDPNSRSVMSKRSGRPVQIIETGQIFDSVRDCAKFVNGHASGIYAVIGGRAWTYRGYHYQYVTKEGESDGD